MLNGLLHCIVNVCRLGWREGGRERERGGEGGREGGRERERGGEGGREGEREREREREREAGGISRMDLCLDINQH